VGNLRALFLIALALKEAAGHEEREEIICATEYTNREMRLSLCV